MFQFSSTHLFAVSTIFFVTILTDQKFTENLHIPGDLCIKWHSIGGRTIAKVLQYDLKIVQSFASDIVVLQLGKNQWGHSFLKPDFRHVEEGGVLPVTITL